MSKWYYVHNLHAVRSVICNGASQNSVSFTASEITTLVSATAQDLSEHSVCKRKMQVRVSFSVVKFVNIPAIF